MEILFSLWLWFAGLFNVEAPPPLIKAPKITFIHASYVDQIVCPVASLFSWSGRVVLDTPFANQKTELNLNIPKLQTLWNEKGPPLLQKASELLNSGFGYEQDVTGLFLCTQIPSWAKPRIISVWQYLPSTPENLRWKDLEFVDVVFHEHLHMLINRKLGWTLHSKLLEKYEEETLFTKIHMHLYALQKQSYLDLNLMEEWEQIILRNKSFPKSYQRAVEIVEIEGAQAFIAELRNQN